MPFVYLTRADIDTILAWVMRGSDMFETPSTPEERALIAKLRGSLPENRPSVPDDDIYIIGFGRPVNQT
jgi:hypothetical protein